MGIKNVAESLLQAEQLKKPIPPLTSSAEIISADDAYQIQLYQVQKKVEQGAKIKGLKIGLTSKAMQEMLNVYTPDYGVILDSMIFDGNTVDVSNFIQAKVEFEIAFVFKKELVGPNITVEDVIDATDYIIPAIEIIDSRIEDWKIKFEDTVADNGSSAGAILGLQKTKLENVTIDNLSMKVYQNDILIDEANSSAVLDNPLNAVVWLANELTKYNVKIQPGMFVLSGALSKAVPFSGGDTFIAEFEQLGTVSVQFVDKG